MKKSRRGAGRTFLQRLRKAKKGAFGEPGCCLCIDFECLMLWTFTKILKQQVKAGDMYMMYALCMVARWFVLVWATVEQI